MGCGVYKNVAEAADAIVRVTETIQPNTAAHDRYAQQYARFQKIYAALKAVD